MCQSTAFVLSNGKEEVVMRDVALVEPREREVRLVDLFGEEKLVKGKIIRINLMEHKIIIGD